MTLQLTCPGSKSMTQRALVIAALAAEPSTLDGALDCDDSRYLVQALRKLGIELRWQGSRIEVEPHKLSGKQQTLYCGNAGTAVRFCSCLATVCDSPMCIDGDERMRQRPIGPLAGALQQLGATVSYGDQEGYPPLTIAPAEDTVAARVAIDGSLSSQYASGLLMVAPRLSRGLVLDLTGESVSRPYLRMTVEMMRRAGVRVEWPEAQRLRVAPGSYRGVAWRIEPDWSTAAFILTAAHLTSRSVEIDGLVDVEDSLQGDAEFAEYLERIEADEGQDFDLTDTPDLIAPLAVAALFANRPTRIRGAAHTRIKESDRIAVLARGFNAVGARVVERPDGLDIKPLREPASGAIVLDPAADHRMAMAFGLLSLRLPNVAVMQPECVSKSFPGFWDVLDRFRG